MKRVFYHHEQREDLAQNGMWRIVSGTKEREDFIRRSAELMANPELFKRAMMKAIDLWPKSCEVNMTSSSTNQRAWFGHAGCFLSTGSPEDCTRLGWHTLTEDQQRVANAAADEAIEAWRTNYLAQNQLGLFDA